MIRLSVSLPKKLRLEVRLVQRRVDSNEKNLVPSLGYLKRIRSGSKFSRFFTHIFSQDKIKKLFGANIAAAVIISGIAPHANLSGAVEQNIVTITDEVNTKTEKGVRYPVQEVKITQGYRLFHPGLDLDGITGDPIYSFMNGTVEAISRSKYAYGNAVLVDHGDGLETLYAHLSKIYVKEGERVDTIDPIGAMGATGHATGDHLHFEVHENGRQINPMSVLPKVTK